MSNKFCSLWEKQLEDGIKYSPGKPVEIAGVKYWLDVYPKNSSTPNAPAFDVYLKPAESREGYSTEPAF
jgi:hypothetical protein